MRVSTVLPDARLLIELQGKVAMRLSSPFKQARKHISPATIRQVWAVWDAARVAVLRLVRCVDDPGRDAGRTRARARWSNRPPEARAREQPAHRHRACKIQQAAVGLAASPANGRGATLGGVPLSTVTARPIECEIIARMVADVTGRRAMAWRGRAAKKVAMVSSPTYMWRRNETPKGTPVTGGGWSIHLLPSSIAEHHPLSVAPSVRRLA